MLWQWSVSRDFSNFSVGAAYINSNSIYTGVGSTSRLMPSIAYENNKVKVGLREGVSYQFIDNEAFNMSAAITPNFRPYDSSDSTTLSGMDRKNDIRWSDLGFG